MKNSLCCGLKIINLHPKLSPSALWAPQPKHKHTTATMLLLLQLPPRLSYTHTHKRARTHTHRPVHTFTQSLSHSSSAVLCFLHPSGSRCCEGGRRGKGREGRGGEGSGARPPCSHGRAECLHCCGSLCNTSGILRPLSPARDGGAVEGRCCGEGVLGQREKPFWQKERQRERERGRESKGVKERERGGGG